MVFAALALSMAEFLIEVGCGRVQYRHFVTGSRGGRGGGVYEKYSRDGRELMESSVSVTTGPSGSFMLQARPDTVHFDTDPVSISSWKWLPL